MMDTELFFRRFTIMEKLNYDEIRSLCEEVFNKINSLHVDFKTYTIITTSGDFVNGYDYFLGGFDRILKYMENNKDNQPSAYEDGQILFELIDSSFEVEYIFKTNKNAKQQLILSNQKIFTINREYKTITKNSEPSYVDTAFDLSMIIVLNGIQAILYKLDYITNKDIKTYLYSLLTKSNGDDKEKAILNRLYNMIIF